MKLTRLVTLTSSCLLILGAVACGSDDSDDGGSGGTSGSGGASGGSGGASGGSAGASGGSAGASGGSAGASGGSGGTSSMAGCDALANEVAKRKAALGCTVDNSTEVKTKCQTVLGTFPACTTVWDTWVTCISGKPDTDWACDADNKASPKPGVCQTEYDAIGACAKS